MSNHTLNINTILHTKDGSKIGNAIVTGRNGYHWEVTTDYGNKAIFTSEEIDKHFNIGWSNVSKEIDGYSCQEMQEMMQADHKHRVAKQSEQFYCPDCEKKVKLISDVDTDWYGNLKHYRCRNCKETFVSQNGGDLEIAAR